MDGEVDGAGAREEGRDHGFLSEDVQEGGSEEVDKGDHAIGGEGDDGEEDETEPPNIQHVSVNTRVTPLETHSS